MILEIAIGQWRLTTTETNHRHPRSPRNVSIGNRTSLHQEVGFERSAFVDAESFHSLPIVRRAVTDGDEVVSFSRSSSLRAVYQIKPKIRRGNFKWVDTAQWIPLGK